MDVTSPLAVDGHFSFGIASSECTVTAVYCCFCFFNLLDERLSGGREGVWHGWTGGEGKAGWARRGALV